MFAFFYENIAEEKKSYNMFTCANFFYKETKMKS